MIEETGTGINRTIRGVDNLREAIKTRDNLGINLAMITIVETTVERTGAIGVDTVHTQAPKLTEEESDKTFL